MTPKHTDSNSAAKVQAAAAKSTLTNSSANGVLQRANGHSDAIYVDSDSSATAHANGGSSKRYGMYLTLAKELAL